MRIDAHHHFWQPARGDYHWMTPAVAPLNRDFLPQDLAPLLQACGVDRTILVQAAQSAAETEFLLDIAHGCAFVAGVVGWTDFADRDAAQRIAQMATERLLVGLRPMVQDIADDDWLLRADLAPAFRAVVGERLVFDALVLPRHLSRLLVVLDQHPDMTVVVDHCAKPDICSRRLDPWRVDMAAVAARPNTFCKLSGIVTEAAPDWTEAELAPYVAHVLACFGPSRVIWGSDWPVVTLAATYERWHRTATALTAGCSIEQRALIFGGNAARIYLSGRGRP